MKRKLIFSILALVLILSLVVIPGCAEEKEKHAILSWGQWSGEYMPLYVSKILLEDELGYTTEIADLSVPASWAAISAGEVDLFFSDWQPNQIDLKEKYAGQIEEFSLLYANNLQGWMVPKWVSEQYGITSVSDLNDPEIARMFDIDDDNIGDVLGCDAAWKCAAITDEEIAGYGLADLYEQKYGAEAMITAAIEGAMKKNEPVLFYMYTPNPFFVRYPVGESIVWLDDPKDFWPVADAYAISSVDWIKNNPEAIKLLEKVEFETADVGWMMAQIEEKGDSAEVLETAAREWMAAHQTEVDSWLAVIK